MNTPPELADGRTFHRLTISGRDFRFASAAEVRSAILRELRSLRSLADFDTGGKRAHVADLALADAAFLRKHAGETIASVARAVVSESMRGRWANGSTRTEAR